MPNLTFLDMSSNLLTSQLPASWGTGASWRSLRAMNLSHNQLDGRQCAVHC